MKQIEYHIKILCTVSENGTVIPVGSDCSIQDERGKQLDMLKYPDPKDIELIWIGKVLSYPMSY
jgi:hypothetical protein